MDIKTALQEAMKTGQKALTEFQAKQLLEQYAIPVVSEAVAANADEAGWAPICFTRLNEAWSISTWQTAIVSALQPNRLSRPLVGTWKAC